MTFWEKWYEWWTSVSATWNSLDAKVQAGTITLSPEGQAAYDQFKASYEKIDAAVGRIDLDDIAELKLIAQGDEIAAEVVELTNEMVSGALNWVDSLFQNV